MGKVREGEGEEAGRGLYVCVGKGGEVKSVCVLPFVYVFL